MKRRSGFAFPFLFKKLNLFTKKSLSLQTQIINILDYVQIH